ncbi:alpha/beta hydrolase [Streptomyces sp. NPDC049954]|uniref:alpha/beta fold hydrolase n=1 Tax=Streptomyces sp. NPDC049954 TaxID=3155779 RepID=UPI0034418780
MRTIELTAGTVEYEDTGGEGPVVVLLHGLAMDGSYWRGLVSALTPGCRVIVPNLPLGGHRVPLRPGADLSPRGIAALEAEFLVALGLRDVTLVGSDSGLFLFAAPLAKERIARLVIGACEVFDNYPPGLPGKAVSLAGRVPGGLWLVSRIVRVRALRRGPTMLGPMTVRPIPHEVTDGWFRGLIENPGVRRDLRAYLTATRPDDMREAAEALRDFDRPTLVVWGTRDRVMPLEHGHRLTALLPDARLVEIPDSGTFIAEDQPLAFARAVADFVGGGEKRESGRSE